MNEGASGDRSSPIQTHHFALDDAIAAFDLGKQPDKAVKVTLEIA